MTIKLCILLSDKAGKSHVHWDGSPETWLCTSKCRDVLQMFLSLLGQEFLENDGMMILKQ